MDSLFLTKEKGFGSLGGICEKLSLNHAQKNKSSQDGLMEHQ